MQQFLKLSYFIFLADTLVLQYVKRFIYIAKNKFARHIVFTENLIDFFESGFYRFRISDIEILPFEQKMSAIFNNMMHGEIQKADITDFSVQKICSKVINGRKCLKIILVRIAVIRKKYVCGIQPLVFILHKQRAVIQTYEKRRVDFLYFRSKKIL